MTQVLGWVSSLILLATLTAQIAKQWRERSAQGVSPWLFAGQILASVGFTTYSYLVRNWVFTVTNGLLLISAIIGFAVTLHFRRSSSRGPARQP